ncbi:MAG: hypothetical protein AAF639_46910 [Chloroflexota bacterium]
MEAHNGRIWVQSETVGTMFGFSLPIS